MTRQHPRTRAIGEAVLDIAWRVTDALDVIARSLAELDGYTTLTETQIHSSSRSSSTETIATRRQGLSAQRDAILQAIADLEHHERRLAHLATEALKHRASEAVQIARCRDAQVGRAGVIEWGDPLCEDLPAKAGICPRCYMREWRWRKMHGLQPRQVEPAR